MLTRLVLSLVIAATVSACFTEPSSPTPPPTLTTFGPVSIFEDDVMSFEYPSTWNQQTFSVPASMARSLVHLSTSVLIDPCTHPGAAVFCGEPVDALDPDGVVIAWVLYEFPAEPGGPSPVPNPSAVAVEIGGRPATVTQETATPECAAVGGEQELYARIDVPDAGDYVEMDACVRGPNQELTGAVIAAMLASVEWRN